MRKRLIVLVAALSLVGCIEADAPKEGQLSASSDRHLTIPDLKRLGCKVDAEPRVESVELPFIGRMDVYGISNGPACASLLVSTLSQSPEYNAGDWAGLRASASGFARKHGYELASYSGEIGEHSEIEVFSRHGQEHGFRYNVQANGYIHSITLLSDSIDASGRFEEILREKL